MSSPRFIIRELEGVVIVQLFDKDNKPLLTEQMEDGQDPYEYIAAVRDSVDAAEISETPRLRQPAPDDPTTRIVSQLKQRIASMQMTINALRDHIQGEEKEESLFTDGLQ